MQTSIYGCYRNRDVGYRSEFNTPTIMSEVTLQSTPNEDFGPSGISYAQAFDDEDDDDWDDEDDDFWDDDEDDDFWDDDDDEDWDDDEDDEW